ncbi:alpha/beta fold hydrolase [Pseudoduganella namucuonensis]|uniref:Pimeloyl-ACP methyl ester carboxylesterase n=1 Tax=Pseudoduganella namucuonensis TaxID=1035707 RepID=A0A1I7LXY2_9BURK|nr:alpha/beta hydrolase [Pseudoduganella namucuonensis]SFV14475.1 Pimeloyl-ACP methyl ester carboxylesterase [Pseudoduganella namucuonensis]
MSKISRMSGTTKIKYALGAVSVLAASWLVVRSQTRQVEQDHPPRGDFVTVDGVRLHYLSQGEGPVVVLLHGNGVTAEDFRNAGLLDRLAHDHRVIAFDRPGFGYSERPRSTVWTPAAQAKLLAGALAQLGVDRAVILAHSWAAMVALQMARSHPRLVAGLVLASGYYYPSARLDWLTATPAIPILGDLLRYTLSPLVGRLMWPFVIRRSFHPQKVPDSFRLHPKWMSLRPDQLRAEAAETAMMIPSAAMLKRHYPELRMPVEIIAGEDDKISAAGHNSSRLHEDIAHSELTILPGAGHMIQHISQQGLAQAVERVVRKATAEVDGVSVHPAAHAAAAGSAPGTSPSSAV